jgi:hypothetical protein
MARRSLPPSRAAAVAVVLGAVAAPSCGESEPGPTPLPTPGPDSWFAFVVQCAGCPGLTNAAIDRSTSPYRARLHVGQATSLRAAVRSPCEPPQLQLQVTRWIAGDPAVIRVEPSSPESAIVTALAPGTSAVTVERRSSDGTLAQKPLKDGAASAGCGVLPDVAFEVLP